MPILEFKCRECDKVQELIYVGPPGYAPQKAMCTCVYGGVAERIISTPARITMADMEKLNKRRQRIKEPVWRDQATGKVTSMY